MPRRCYHFFTVFLVSIAIGWLEVFSMKVFFRFSFSNFILLCMFWASVAQTPSPSPSPKPLNEDFKKIKQEYSEALAVIKDNHFTGNRLNYNQLSTVSMNYMLQLLDPHSIFLDAKEAEEFRSRINAQYFGIGTLIAELSDGQRKIADTFIRTPFKDAPAFRAGLRYGDRIVEINGVSMAGEGFDEVRKHLLGPRGTKVILVVERNGDPLKFDIIRDAIPTPSIPDAYIIRPGIGYVAMTEGLERTTHDELRKALARLKAQGMKFLILDLRENGGGLAKQACLVVSEFIPRGEVIFKMKGRREEPEGRCISENDAPDNTPIVALINQYTASSAEFLAGGLQDTDRALLVGENTFGKGLVQNVFEFEGGSRIHLTTSRYQTATGRMIQRDYSGESLYRYFREAGSSPEDDPANNIKTSAFTTRTGRIFYGGGGIKPDETMKASFVLRESLQWRNRLNDPIFAFTKDLVAGKIKQLETYRIDRPVLFDHELKRDEFPVTKELYQAFRAFAAEQYKLPGEGIDNERKYVEQRLRTELVTAAYGPQAAQRITNEYDVQLQRAVELLPQAKEIVERSFTIRSKKP